MSTIENYVSLVGKMVDAKLDEALPSAATVPTKLHEAMRYSIFSGGKRLRPVLCIASCEAVGGNAEFALMPAIALEALHTYTLIHDDLPAMDDDDLRRGKPTVHKAFDEATAILAGDALLTISFEWLASTGSSVLVDELAKATGSLGTVGGQADDMDAKDMPTSIEQLVAIHERKTAALFRASCRIGAMSGRASTEEVDALGEFGYYLGMAFQMKDDISDMDEVTFKIFTKEEALQIAHEHEVKAYAALDRVSGDTSVLHDIAVFGLSSFAL